MSSWWDTIPFISQVKSAVQALSGDLDGARETQEVFSKQAPIISQARSAIEAATGDTDAAKRTQEAFLHGTLENTPILSQAISAGYAITGDSTEAKRIQQGFVDHTVQTIIDPLTWVQSGEKLQHSTSLADRTHWMKPFGDKKLCDLLLPGTHDSTTYRFVDAAGITPWAKCQQFSIYEQLKGGIRYLDIRVSKSRRNDEIYCAHAVFQTIPFQDVINDVLRFFGNENSGTDSVDEVVVFAVQGEENDDQLAAAKAIAKSAFATLFIDSATGSETLTSLKRKILYVESHKCGTLKINNSWDQTAHFNPSEVVIRCINYAKLNSRTPQTLFLMALEPTQNAGDDPAHGFNKIPGFAISLEDLAKYTNYAILHGFLMDTRAVAGANVINMDFANDEIIAKVISLN